MSMNDTEEEMYDYDYNSTCEHDPISALSDTTLLVVYYVLFCFGLLGMFLKTYVAHAYIMYIYRLMILKW